MATTDRKLVWIAEIVLWTTAKLGSSEVEHLEFPQLFLLINQIINGFTLL